MGSTMKGAGIFLAQFAGDTAPFDTLVGITAWAAGLGYDAVQIPTFDARLFDLERAATSQTYCDEVKGICADAGVAISELSTHLQGQLVAVHPAYHLAFDAFDAFDAFAPTALHGKPAARQEWAVDQMLKAAKAARNLGIDTTVSFSGSLAFPYVYPWPQRPPGLIDAAFAELARRWRPILDAYDEQGVDIGFEIHPGEDLFDGATYERFVAATGNHDRALINYDPSHFLLQQLDYLGFIDLYHDRICAFHVKDAEFNPTARQGFYSGYADWTGRAARFRSLGDGQVNFAGIFSRLCQYGYDGHAVLEWECCLKSPEQGAAEGAPFIRRHIIEATNKAFDDFAGGDTDTAKIRKMLGMSA